MTQDVYTSKEDLVGRFRIFETSTTRDNEQKLTSYLAAYSTEALTEPEIIANLERERHRLIKAESEKPQREYQIKRLGKDEDDLYWNLGKIHGIENIAYLSDEELEACYGNPVALQHAINNVKISKDVTETWEQQVEAYTASLNKYKEDINKMNLSVSDRKKMLALPFYLAKRRELPEPKKGQFEYQLFEELYGVPWHWDDGVQVDHEAKITEFNYEEFIHPELLKTMDTDSVEFKRMIKLMNHNSKTKYEQHQANKAQFKTYMPLFAKLYPNEMRALLHLGFSESPEGVFLDNLCDNKFEQELAQISERENYAIKNRYRHNAKTLAFADPKRMPVDERKVKDMLRNQHIFRDKMNSEIGTYQTAQDNPQLQNGVLTYLNEAASGEMKDLINDVGINRDKIPFYNLKAMTDITTKNKVYDTDRRFGYLMNAMFTPLDMTDHEDSFVGWNEVGGDLPLNRLSWLSPYQDEPHPQTNNLADIEDIDEKPIRLTSQTMQGLAFDRAHPPDPDDPEEDDYGVEDGGDSEGDEEGEEGEGAEGEAEYGDYGEYDEEDPADVWPLPDSIPHVAIEDRFFVAPKGS